MIRIMLVDDHNLVRKGICLILETNVDIRVIGEADNCDDAIRKTHQLRPDIILMDLSFPEGRNGFSVIREIQSAYPNIDFIILSMYDDQQYVQQAAGMGVKGYLLKNGDKEQLLQAVRSVSQGQTYYQTVFPMEQIRLWMKSDHAKTSILSYREAEIVRMTALGYTNREISAKLSISVKTVENHKYNAMIKLNLKSKQQMMKYAMSNLMDLST